MYQYLSPTNCVLGPEKIVGKGGGMILHIDHRNHVAAVIAVMEVTAPEVLPPPARVTVAGLTSTSRIKHIQFYAFLNFLRAPARPINPAPNRSMVVGSGTGAP